MLKSAPAVPVIEVPNEGLISLLNRPVLLFCDTYIYHGILLGVNDTCVLLDKASIVYETGKFDAAKFTDVQRLPSLSWYVKRSKIESFGLSTITPS